VLDGDPDAAAVLAELLDHSESLVRDWAAEGLERIGSGETGPTVRRTHFLFEQARRMPGLPAVDTPSGGVIYRIHGGVGPGSY